MKRRGFLFLSALALSIMIACGDVRNATVAPRTCAGEANSTPTGAQGDSRLARVWVSDGSPNKFGRPTELAMDAQANVYVVDGGNHRIQVFDCNGKFLRMWGRQGSADGQFLFFDSLGHFGSVAVDESGNVYVFDHNMRIQKFTSRGEFLAKWGRPGQGDGEFGDYVGLATDSQGNVYATDPVNYRIQKFDDHGTFLAKWDVPRCGDYRPKPFGIAVARDGNVYITDADNYCVLKFDGNGKPLGKIGKFSETNILTGIALDGQGNIYVADNGLGTIVKLDKDGNRIAAWQSSDAPEVRFDSPQGMAVDAQGNLYVVMVSGERVEKLRQP